MLELAPGVYTSPHMSRAVRERVWATCCEWASALPDDGGVLMTWQEKQQPSGQAVLVLGWPKKELIELNGLWLDRSEPRSLTTE